MLYKYADLNDPHLKENIKHNQLYFNTPNNFNDVFDIYGAFHIGDRDFLDNLLKKEGVPKNFVQTLTDEQLMIYASMLDRLNATNSKYGITCFSERNDNIIMWALYANKNQGVCLGFDLECDGVSAKDMLNCDANESKFGKFTASLITVAYNQNRPTIEYRNDYDIHSLLSTKFRDWEHEQEIRIMLTNQKENVFPTLVNYRQEYLKTITFGPMTTIKQFNSFYEFLKGLRREFLYKIARLHPYEYKYDIFDVGGDNLDQLTNNFRYILKNANVIFNRYIILQNAAKDLSARRKREIFQHIIENIPIHYIHSYFQLFFHSDAAEFLNLEKVERDEKNKFQVAMFIQMLENEFRNVRETCSKKRAAS